MNKVLGALVLGAAGWYAYRTFASDGAAAPPPAAGAGNPPAGAVVGEGSAPPVVSSSAPATMKQLLEAKRLQLNFPALMTADEWNWTLTQVRGRDYTFEQLNSTYPREQKLTVDEYVGLAVGAGLTGLRGVLVPSNMGHGNYGGPMTGFRS